MGGIWGGRRLAAPRGDLTRPTSDRVREALFSILGDVDQAHVLDLCAGTGAVGLEALSRGAAHATFVEKNPAPIKALQANMETLGVAAEQGRVLRLDLRRAPGRLATLHPQPYDIVFADPPYDLVPALAPSLFALMQSCLSETGVGIIEHRSRDPSPDGPEDLVRDDIRTYGEATLAFFRRHP